MTERPYRRAFWQGFVLGCVCTPALYWLLVPIVTGQWSLL